MTRDERFGWFEVGDTGLRARYLGRWASNPNVRLVQSGWFYTAVVVAEQNPATGKLCDLGVFNSVSKRKMARTKSSLHKVRKAKVGIHHYTFSRGWNTGIRRGCFVMRNTKGVLSNIGDVLTCGLCGDTYTP